MRLHLIDLNIRLFEAWTEAFRRGVGKCIRQVTVQFARVGFLDEFHVPHLFELLVSQSWTLDKTSSSQSRYHSKKVVRSRP